jgi:2-oxoglutarate ferredoxin oxidoreductase subunit gamma
MSPITDLSAPPPIGEGPSPARIGLLADRPFLQVRFGGTGEQGVVLVGVVLAMAATRDHRYVVQTQTYGLGARGGYGHSDVIISDTPIDYPELQTADVLVTLSQDAADGYSDLLTPTSIFIYDSEEVPSPPPFAGTSYGIPFTRLAYEVVGEVDTAPNVLTLGAVVGITGVVSVESLEKAVLATIPPGTREANGTALKLGLTLDAAAWSRDRENRACL